MEPFNIIIFPVSYTHLDVYKRQGGSIGKDIFCSAFESDDPASVLSGMGYKEVCDGCMSAGFTEFEKACDDYLMSYVKDAKYKALTVEPIVG